jgi:uncharacterized protein YbaR (Trm112 family)
MKPWLLNILACPIDKHHPLNAYFFTWETDAGTINRLAKDVGLPVEKHENGYRQIAKQYVDGTISPEAIKKIKDSSDSNDTPTLLAVALDVLNRLGGLQEPSEESLLQEHKRDLDALYRFMNLVEVDKGLLVCPECGRWYPIGSAVETIPEMLPDDLREKDRDLKWMERWTTLIPKRIIEEGKPYSLKDKEVQ